MTHTARPPSRLLRMTTDRLVRAAVHVDAASAIQAALVEQRRTDLAEYVMCPACGGLGAVADYARHIPGHPHRYFGKVCPDCGGRGF